jgi:hypothetical protein
MCNADSCGVLPKWRTYVGQGVVLLSLQAILSLSRRFGDMFALSPTVWQEQARQSSPNLAPLYGSESTSVKTTTSNAHPQYGREQHVCETQARTIRQQQQTKLTTNRFLFGELWCDFAEGIIGRVHAAFVLRRTYEPVQ